MFYECSGLALERKIRFLSEKRTEPYMRYGEGALEEKNEFGAKSLRGQAT